LLIAFGQFEGRELSIDIVSSNRPSHDNVMAAPAMIGTTTIPIKGPSEF
jgi:hypothetical protein